LEVIGHRGAASLAPENSIVAIRTAIGGGADGVEIDVRRSADGVLVLMHDNDVARLGGAGRVDENPFAILEAFGVATLDQALEAVPIDRSIVIEIKGHPWEAGYDAAEPVAADVAVRLAADGPRRVVVSSFNPLALRVVRDATPAVTTAVLTSVAFDLDSNLAAAVDGGHDECHVPADLLEEAFVDRAHAAAKRVVAWTVDDPDHLRTFASWGVDGVICDDPLSALAVLRRSG
jgi:glycerophosphoryl diester phosphodiesterase